jgi:hypothetical protein
MPVGELLHTARCAVFERIQELHPGFRITMENIRLRHCTNIVVWFSYVRYSVLSVAHDERSIAYNSDLGWVDMELEDPSVDIGKLIDAATDRACRLIVGRKAMKMLSIQIGNKQNG